MSKTSFITLYASVRLNRLTVKDGNKLYLRISFENRFILKNGNAINRSSLFFLSELTVLERYAT